MSARRCTALAALALTFTAGCGGGVPIEIRLDGEVVTIDLDEELSPVLNNLGGGLFAAGGEFPELWPDEFPDICEELPFAGPAIPLDLTPDAALDPEAAELYGPVNDGLVSRIEINRFVLRAEKNTTNVALPVIDVQVADQIDADPDDRRAWRTIGHMGADGRAARCDDENPSFALAPGEIADLPFVWEVGGETFLENQLSDPRCVADAERDPESCKELAIRMRSRLLFDSAVSGVRPRGKLQLRSILIVTFFVDPF